MTVHIPGRVAVLVLAVTLAIPTGIVLAGVDQRFTDVPPSNPFFNDIEALAASGVTSGCTSTTYCPKSNVTREQMAAFLNRLGALGPGIQPKVNADRVDGRHANELTRVVSMSSGTQVNIVNNVDTYVFGPDLVINAPAAGFVTVNVGITFRTPDCTSICFAYGHIRHVESGTASADTGVYVASPSPLQASGSVNRVFAVSAGVNTFRVEIHRTGTDGIIRGFFVNGTALYTPYGSTGAGTLAADESTTDALHATPSD